MLDTASLIAGSLLLVMAVWAAQITCQEFGSS